MILILSAETTKLYNPGRRGLPATPARGKESSFFEVNAYNGEREPGGI
jgi:hypothetical protein